MSHATPFAIAAGAAASLVVFQLALPVIGFTVAGVQAGTAAAAWQASIGNVAAGSIFAMLQSLGATGGLAAPVVGTAVAGGLASTAAAIGLSRKKNDDDDDDEEEDDKNKDQGDSDEAGDE